MTDYEFEELMFQEMMNERHRQEQAQYEAWLEQQYVEEMQRIDDKEKYPLFHWKD